MQRPVYRRDEAPIKGELVYHCQIVLAGAKLPAKSAVSGAPQRLPTAPGIRQNMFGFLRNYFSNDIAIDLGTANTLIYMRGKGGGVSAHLPAVETFAPFELYGHREDGSRRRGDEAASVAKGAARCAGAAIAHRTAGTAVDGQLLYLGGEASGEKCRIGGEWKWFGHGRGACAPIIYKVYGGGRVWRS